MKICSFQVDDKQIGIVIIESPGVKENRLSLEHIIEIENILSELENETSRIEEENETEAIVLISGKQDYFISGLDLKELFKFKAADEGRSYSLRIQEVIEKIERSRIPFLAAINGVCFGVGLEICLACKYRIATEGPNTLFGFPDVKLGLICGGGGTQRLPLQVGTSCGIDLLTTGKTINSQKARRIGLIDEIVPNDALLEIGKMRALEIIKGKIRSKGSRPSNRLKTVYYSNSVFRNLLLKKKRKEAMVSTNHKNLAPIMSIEAMEVGLNSSFNRGLHVESVYFGELASGEVSRNLIHLSLASCDIRHDPVVRAKGVKPKKIRKVGIVGAGQFGSALAALAADNGFTVRLMDKDELSVGRALRDCYEYFEKKYNNGVIAKFELGNRFDLISCANDYSGFKRADIVFDTIRDESDVKLNILNDIESVTSEECAIALNVSAVQLTKVSNHLKRLDNVVGIHFSLPIYENPLTEIVITQDTSDATIATALDFSKNIGKIPIVVKDGAGFFTNRVIFAYINEAIRLLSEVGSLEEIDNAMIELGFREGPFIFMDKIGIDDVIRWSNTLYQAFGERFNAASKLDILFEGEDKQIINRKAFYSYYNDKKIVNKYIYKLLPFRKSGEYFPKLEIQERLSLAIINEAVKCLEDGIIRSPRDGDVGAVIGVGFPSFLGGPFKFIDNFGIENTIKKLELLSSKHEQLFIPANLLQDYLSQGKKFYDE
jgi:3-hydroxyacyl-CoA dehydrogenase / enoyl-CoA hydratase / 3-hydroxybutyryl-CoA epimerase